jgi:hypothetical protein
MTDAEALVKKLTRPQRRVLLLMPADGSWWRKPGHINYDMIFRINERSGERLVEDNPERANRFYEWRLTALGTLVQKVLQQ